MTSLPIESIVIGRRHRKDMGDLKGFADSIAEQGLLCPICITEENELVDGERRLRACRDILGLAEIDVRIVDVTSIVEGEFAANELRKAFTPEERVQIGRSIEERIGNRQGARTDKELVENFPQVSPAVKTRQVAAEKAGFGNDRTYRQAKEVVEAAEREPEKFQPLVEEMNRTGKVGGAHRKLKKHIDEQQILSVKPTIGRHRTLIIDPPWDYGHLSLAGRGAVTYATMTNDELAALPVPSWAEDECHLYLWTTNNFVPVAVDLLRAWGFQHKTVLTWVKPRWGLGSYFRNSTEQCLFATRGATSTRVDNVATHFEAPIGEHSAKPEVFYDIVRRASYPSIGEAFQREARDGITNLFGGRAAA